jgi:acyl carrier protein
MIRSMTTLDNDQPEICTSDRAGTEELPDVPGMRVPVKSGPLTHERVVAEIVRAIRAIRPTFPAGELAGETRLALDLGLESASRVELLLEVERGLDVALDVGVMAVFAELTIAELADLVVSLPEADTGPIPDDAA